MPRFLVDFLDRVSRRLEAAISPYAGRPEYGDLRTGPFWRKVDLPEDPSYCFWTAQYEAANDSGHLIAFRFRPEKNEFSITGKRRDNGKREPDIFTPDEEEAYRLFQQRIEEIPEYRARCGAAAEI